MDSESQIRAAVQKIVQVTLGSSREDLSPLFHENVTFQSPDSQSAMSGRDACLQSYADFRNAAQLHDVQTEEPQIDILGTTAIATYGFRIHYTFDGKTNRESGRDLLVFSRENDRWLVVWRTLIVANAES